jgi:hypothetical protein
VRECLLKILNDIPKAKRIVTIPSGEKMSWIDRLANSIGLAFFYLVRNSYRIIECFVLLASLAQYSAGSRKVFRLWNSTRACLPSED